jgi:type IV pilus assembly protein PilQ
MNELTKKAAGLIFLAAMSVYSDQAIAVTSAKSANSNDKPTATDVKLIDDPFATSQPSTTDSSSSNESTKGGPVAPLQMNADGTFSLNITAGADVVEQLRVIGFQAQMSIIPSKEVHGSLPAMDLYNVTVPEALDALLHTNGFAWREKGKFIYVYSAKEVADMEKANRVANTAVFHLFYTPAANAVPMIKPVLSADAQVSYTTAAASGLTTGTSDTGGDSHATDDIIVVTDYPENLDRVKQVLKEIDRRPQQILIEATILSATLNEQNELGIDFNVLGGVDFSTITEAVGQITQAAASNGSFTANKTVDSVGTGNNFSNFPGGFKVGVVSRDVSVFLSALEGVTDTTVLANPKILTLNKQKGEVIVGKETGYLTTTTTETTSTQTVQFLDTGTRLIFRPFIGDDGYIRMEIHPEDSDGGLQTAANLPFKSTTEVTSNVMVKDGHTIVIGGLFRESSQSTRSQIPVLGNLPWAGPLFRQQADTTVRQELIVLITPHIIEDQDAYADMSKEELKDGQRLRVGVRQGMMFWGRERLADMYYESAVTEMNKPHPDRKSALWNLDSATNLNPKFLEAIKMKEDLTGKEVTAADNSSIRSFVRRAILEDPAPSTQPSAELVLPMPKSTVVAETYTPMPQSIARVQPPQSIAQAPASQPIVEAPASQPVAETPTTTPAAEAPQAPSVAEAPTSQPVAEAPASQPVVEIPQPVAETPATQPVVEIPATQPVAEAPASQPVVEVPATQPVADAPATQPVAEMPATQPVADSSQSPSSATTQPSGENHTSITELPSDEAAGSATHDDAGKK